MRIDESPAAGIGLDEALLMGRFLRTLCWAAFGVNVSPVIIIDCSLVSNPNNQFAYIAHTLHSDFAIQAFEYLNV